MLRGMLAASVVIGGLVFAPLKIVARPDAGPKLAMSEACAETGNCCFEPQSICISNGLIVPNMRPSDGRACTKPKPGT